MEPIEFMNYDRMTDDLYTLGHHFVLRFVVELAYYSPTSNKREFFHKEFKYTRQGNSVVTMRRHYGYYLSIESTGGEDKINIKIPIKKFLIFREGINTAVSWFRDKKFKNLFVKSKKELYVTNPAPSYEVNGLPGANYIKFDPVIIDAGIASDDKYPGLRITLSDPNVFVDIDVDTLMTLGYIVNGINMISMAQSMLAYLTPPIGYNQLDFTDGPRDIMSERGKAFFNRLDQAPKTKGSILGRQIGDGLRKPTLEDIDDE